MISLSCVSICINSLDTDRRCIQRLVNIFNMFKTRIVGYPSIFSVALTPAMSLVNSLWITAFLYDVS